MSSAHLLLYIVRHAESEANASGTFAARVIDPPLSPKGVKDAQRIAERLASEGIARIYASPLRRSMQTAQTLASGCNLDLDILPDLKEVNVGILDGKSSKSKANWDIYERVVERWSRGDLEARFQGGESLGEVCQRARKALGIVSREPGSGGIAVVSHAVFLMLFLPLLLKDSLTNMKRYDLPRGSITIVLVQEGRTHLQELGSTEHLQQ